MIAVVASAWFVVYLSGLLLIFLLDYGVHIVYRAANPCFTFGGVFWLFVTFWQFSNFEGLRFIIVRGENPSSAMGE